MKYSTVTSLPAATSAIIGGTDSNKSSGGGLNTGGKVAVGVAVPVGVIALAMALLIGAFLWRRSKKKNAVAPLKKESDSEASNSYHDSKTWSLPGSPRTNSQKHSPGMAHNMF